MHGCCSSFTLSHLSNSHNTEKNCLSSEITVLEWHKTSIITFLNQRLENLNLPLHSSIKARWHHYKTVAYATMVWGRPSGPSIKLNGIEGWMEKKINASVCSEDLTKPLNLYKKILFISKTEWLMAGCCHGAVGVLAGWLSTMHTAQGGAGGSLEHCADEWCGTVQKDLPSSENASCFMMLSLPHNTEEARRGDGGYKCYIQSWSWSE